MEIKSALVEYRQLVEREKTIGARKKELATFIKKHAQENGVQDGNGSFYQEDEDFIFGSQARKKVALNFDRARDFFTSKGMWKEVVKYEEKIDEDKVASLLEEEKVTMEELEEITDIKVSYAIDVREKEKEEDMPEVQVMETRKKVKPVLKIKSK